MIQLTALKEAPASFNGHPNSLLLGKSSGDQQRTAFDHGEGLFRSEKGNNILGSPLVHQQSDSSMENMPQSIEPTGERDITVSPETDVQRNKTLAFTIHR